MAKRTATTLLLTAVPAASLAEQSDPKGPATTTKPQSPLGNMMRRAEEWSNELAHDQGLVVRPAAQKAFKRSAGHFDEALEWKQKHPYLTLAGVQLLGYALGAAQATPTATPSPNPNQVSWDDAVNRWDPTHPRTKLLARRNELTDSSNPNYHLHEESRRTAGFEQMAPEKLRRTPPPPTARAGRSIHNPQQNIYDYYGQLEATGATGATGAAQNRVKFGNVVTQHGKPITPAAHDALWKSRYERYFDAHHFDAHPDAKFPKKMSSFFGGSKTRRSKTRRSKTRRSKTRRSKMRRR